MAAGIAHELNTPLTYIMGNLELLAPQPSTPSQREMLASIARGAERIRSLAQSLLAFSRPAPEEMGLPRSERRRRAGLELCHYQIAQGRRARSTASSRPDCRRSSGSRTSSRWRSSTWWSTPSTRWRRRAAASPWARRGAATTWRSRCRDSGPGIPEAIRHSVFEPFVTTKPEGKGTGLGLSTVLMVVERHKGRIDFTTAPSGTTFRISLPAAQPA